MQVRPILNIEKLKSIWETHYKEEFSFPDFTSQFMYNFEVIDDSGEIITGGGIKLIPEIVLMTDKDKDIRDRKLALYTALDFSIYTAQQLHFDNLHCFVKDDSWGRRLKKTGFHPIQGEGLILEI